TREGRIGPTARNCSGQWSEAALPLAQIETRTGPGQGSARGLREFAPILGCAQLIGGFDFVVFVQYYWALLDISRKEEAA
ncbi:MAG: hypothetical protein OXH93_19950, partial [Caldilineaceae bacterium]|nr:hypothetical protein [Caldilineaceae bacterium]